MVWEVECLGVGFMRLSVETVYLELVRIRFFSGFVLF